MQLSHPTLVFKPLIPLLPISYLLPLCPHHRLMLLAVFLHLLLPLPPPDSLRAFQLECRGLRTRSTELLHFILSHLVDRICIQKSCLNLSSSFRIPWFSPLRSDRTHSRSGILSSDTKHASGGVIIFVRQGLYFTELSTSSLYSLDPYSDYIGVNISLNNSSSLSNLNVMLFLFALLRPIAEPTTFFPPFFPPTEIFSFWGTSTAIALFCTQKVLLTPVRRKYSIGSSPLISFPSMPLTRGYLFEFFRATCPEESHSPFCSPFCPAKFLAAATNLSSSTATGPDKVAYPVLKHLSCSDMDFLLHIFNLSWSLHSFPSIWKTSIIPSMRWESLSSLLLPSGLSLSPPASQSFLNTSFYLLSEVEFHSLSPPGRFPPWTVYS